MSIADLAKRPSGESVLLAAAQAGDDHAFAALTEPHRRALHLHCYRMLGSVHDAEDALQETLVRAWRGLGRFEPHAPVRAWLYRIATNVCLRAAERRTRRGPSPDEVARYLQPYPDALLELVPSPAPGPEAATEEREGVELALIAAMQLLPAKQRAVLVLRDVLGWPARDVAELFEDSVAAVNSSLQRARARLDAERRAGRLARDHAPSASDEETALVRRFLSAWEAVDIDAIVELLADDSVLTMPPEPMRIVGRQAIGEFFATVPAGGALREIRLVPTHANRQPALAAYWRDPEDGVFCAYGVMVLAFRNQAIAGITGFAGYPTLMPAFGLPAELGA